MSTVIFSNIAADFVSSEDDMIITDVPSENKYIQLAFAFSTYVDRAIQMIEVGIYAQAEGAKAKVYITRDDNGKPGQELFHKDVNVPSSAKQPVPLTPVDPGNAYLPVLEGQFYWLCIMAYPGPDIFWCNNTNGIVGVGATKNGDHWESTKSMELQGVARLTQN